MAHHCHFPNCRKSVPPKMWGCREHWFMLPAAMRAAIWRHYRPGQEIDKKPSAVYIDTVLKVRTWIHASLQEEVQRLAASLQPEQRELEV